MSRSFRSMTAMALLWWLLLAAQPAGQSPLVGRWDAEARSGGGALGIWFELADQGACQQTVGAMVDATWSLEGEGLDGVHSQSSRPAGRPARIGVVPGAYADGGVRRSAETHDPVGTLAGRAVHRRCVELPAPGRRHGIRGGTHKTDVCCSGCPSRPRVADGRWMRNRVALTVGKESTTSRWRIAGDKLTMEAGHRVAHLPARTGRRDSASVERRMRPQAVRSGPHERRHDICYTSGRELAALIRGRRISPRAR